MIATKAFDDVKKSGVKPLNFLKSHLLDMRTFKGCLHHGPVTGSVEYTLLTLELK